MGACKSLDKINDCVDLNKQKYHNDLIFWLKQLRKPIRGLNLAGPTEFKTRKYSATGYCLKNARNKSILLVPERDAKSFQLIKRYVKKYDTNNICRLVFGSLSETIELYNLRLNLNFLGLDYYSNPSRESFKEFKRLVRHLDNDAVISITHSRWPATHNDIRKYWTKVKTYLKSKGYQIVNDQGEERIYGNSCNMYNYTVLVRKVG